jgi:uncharacterized HAD superfamily protein
MYKIVIDNLLKDKYYIKLVSKKGTKTYNRDYDIARILDIPVNEYREKLNNFRKRPYKNSKKESDILLDSYKKAQQAKEWIESVLISSKMKNGDIS